MIPSHLRILHAPGGAAGQPGCISREQSALGHTAHSLRVGENKFNFPADIVLPHNGVQSYNKAFATYGNAYDVFHFYFRPFFYNNLHCAYPMGLDILALRAAGKIVVLHFRGSEIRLHSMFQQHSPYNYIAEDPDRIVSKFPEQTQRQYLTLMSGICNQILVTDPELQTYCPDAKIVPRAIETENWPYIGVQAHNDPPLIVHAPSRRTVKGTEFLLEALQGLEKRGIRFRLQLIENMEHAEAREAYQKADIIVDQMRIGWYGVLSVEGMALGKPVLAYIREDLRGHLPPQAPLHMTSPETIAEDLELLINDPAYRTALGARAREYVETVHDSKKVAADLVELYKECAQREQSIDFTAVGEYINTLPYYIQKHSLLGKKRRHIIQRTTNYLREHGLKNTSHKIYQKIFRK